MKQEDFAVQVYLAQVCSDGLWVSRPVTLYYFCNPISR